MRRFAEILVVALGLVIGPVLMPGVGFPVPYIDVFSGTARAVQPDEVLPDPVLEERARALSAGLRCLVCQNQSIDDSDAALAKDLRVLVRERLVAGDTDEGVIDFIVSRYGEFVLLNPRLSAGTLLLWGAPILLLVAGAGFAFFAARGRGREAKTAGLTAEEEIAVERALREKGL